MHYYETQDTIYDNMYIKKIKTSSIVQNKGFALISTILIASLLLVMAIAMLQLVPVTVKNSQLGKAKSEAEANARLALMIAIGELQDHAGPDQRITASANIDSSNTANPQWMGVWSTENDSSLPVWLVSGNESLITDELANLTVYPLEYRLPNSSQPEDTSLYPESSIILQNGITAPIVKISTLANETGHYSWAITDEGVKARTDIISKSENTSSYQKLLLARSPLEPGLSLLGTDFTNLQPDNPDDTRDKLLSMDSLDLVTQIDRTGAKYRHDLTVGGYGLPVNVVKGRMKADLSSLFDTSPWSERYQEEIMGAKAATLIQASASIYDFNNINDPSKFYLDSTLTKNGLQNTGPNWGVLYNYAQLWKQNQSGTTPIIKLHPRVAGDLRTTDWAPYQSVNSGAFKNDPQHINSSVSPVISMLQIGTRIKAVEQKNATTGDPEYRLKLQIKPLIGIWNPHNVTIAANNYNFAWAAYPYIRLGFSSTTTSGQVRIWLREYWRNKFLNDLDTWFNLTTPTITMEPGEFRLFSVDTDADISKENILIESWSETGGFIVDLNYSNFGDNPLAEQPVILPENSKIWYEAMYLEDAQHPETHEHFEDTYIDGVSSSWLAFRPKADSGHNITRISNLWQTPKVAQRDNLPYAMPEQVNPSPSEYLKVDIANLVDSPHHIGTWRMSIRTSSQAVDGQNLRTWLDSNPRFAQGNPLWDGSKIGSTDGATSYEGFNFISPFLGATYDDSDDGGPGGRGKIAEGQNEAPAFPEAIIDNGRYRGFGGYSTTSEGQNRVILYDSPRSPLISLGQFQHAQLSRYLYESGFPFGNSYANPRIPLDSTSKDNFNGIAEFTMSDISHTLNEALWDDYFFSTIAKGYTTATDSGNLDDLFSIEDLRSGTQLLPNPRYEFMPLGADTTLAEIHADAGDQGIRAISSRIGIKGAFNINSTSKTAWKAILASMANSELPTMNVDGTHKSWEAPEGVRFSRFGHHLNEKGWETSEGIAAPSFWNGYRHITEVELDSLAEAIVTEIKLRGPFRSFADFVNRDPDSADIAIQRKGALQAALDNTINKAADLQEVGDQVSQPAGTNFSNASDAESTSAGYAGYVTQADLLQSLAPILQPRSDYFCIRTKGESLDNNGNVIATAYCEAYVQRTASYIDSADEPHVTFDELSSQLNIKFGRKFEIISFRWLSSEEI